MMVNIDHHPSNPALRRPCLCRSCLARYRPNPFRAYRRPKIAASRKRLRRTFTSAISTDTGSFQYPNTTARTFEIAAELIRLGVDVGRVSQLLYEKLPARRIELLRELLGNNALRRERPRRQFQFELGNGEETRGPSGRQRRP